MNQHIIAVAKAIRSDRYMDAQAVFAAGSIVRGEGTPYSDLDLVVVYASLPKAYRESFRFDGYPVEAFVHDPETLEYFFVEIDRASGVPALPAMILEGIEIPAPSELSQALKRRASAIVAEGPPPLDEETERRMRYVVSDLVDDLRAPRSRDELTASGARLYEQLADYYLRRQGRWSARGKSIPRALQQADAPISSAFSDAFSSLFARGEPGAVVALAEDILRRSGGPLFDGFRSDASPEWRRRPKPVA